MEQSLWLVVEPSGRLWGRMGLEELIESGYLVPTTLPLVERALQTELLYDLGLR
jgi:hypothetical protein